MPIEQKLNLHTIQVASIDDTNVTVHYQKLLLRPSNWPRYWWVIKRHW